MFVAGTDTVKVLQVNLLNSEYSIFPLLPSQVCKVMGKKEKGGHLDTRFIKKQQIKSMLHLELNET